MKNKSHWEVVFVALLCTAVGIVVGRRVAPDAATDTVGDAAAAAAPVFSLALRTNLGIETAPIELGSFDRAASMAAVVVDTPKTVQPVYAPIGGRIATIEGSKVRR